ncbi:MAG: tRNA (adenosine(37)-N6)-threonylcarbamoyltransferase complex ATPase subunit type 1 TsaE [Armatimonadota bacterium]
MGCRTSVTVSKRLTYHCGSPEATRVLARALARHLRAGDVVALVGPLGAGKTCFASGLAEALGVEGRVASPSFVVARFHDGPTPLVHADAYRLSGAEDLLDAGLDDWLRVAVVAVEWADLAEEALPADRLTVALATDGGGRRIELTATGPRSLRALEALEHDSSGHRDLEPTS